MAVSYTHLDVYKRQLHVFLDIGDALLSSGAEIFRVEDTLNRMGYACGATPVSYTHLDVYKRQV